MWIKDNITRTGKEVYYESELIEEIRTIAKTACLICCECTEDDIVEQCGYRDILSTIKSYEGER